MTKDTVARKLKKLLDKARSAEELGNAEEAATFSAKVQELLTRHELTMSDVEYAALAEEDPIESEWFDPLDHDLPSKRTRVKWQQDLAEVLARAFFCQIIVHPGSNMISFVGRKSHRQVVTYVYERLIRDVLRLQEEGYAAAWERYRENGDRGEYSGFKASFRRGFVHAIRTRLREESRKRREDLENEGGNGTSLVRLDNAGKQVRRWMSENLNLRRGGGLRGRQGSNRSGFQEGHRQGKRANLSGNGIDSRGKSPRSLGSGS